MSSEICYISLKSNCIFQVPLLDKPCLSIQTLESQDSLVPLLLEKLSWKGTGVLSLYFITYFSLLKQGQLKSASKFHFLTVQLWKKNMLLNANIKRKLSAFIVFYNLCLLNSCAKVNLKKVSLELGGKSPLIIFSDCDMDKAVRMVRDQGSEFTVTVFIYLQL